ncbi:uncharacterized protein L203_104402 [Cryptococcus depauperatus CBS 7841]|uniref:Endonuclease/exonuclease/phosphatase domain-containing protein n=1 Tax=Cryptococcus depauperatus CBS 7841 TaxID=1295531 RepID=A0AAJ8JVK5_9TREE
MPPKYILTPEQQAIAEQRRAERAARKATDAKKDESMKFLRREWLELRTAHNPIKVLTWNTENLCSPQRWHIMLNVKSFACRYVHVGYPRFDGQECDMLPALLPSLPNHTPITAAGPGKSHGLVILYNNSIFTQLSSKVIHLDFENLIDNHPDGNSMETTALMKRARASSRYTKNIALLAALSSNTNPKNGVIVATTHLFWHPKYTYERTRQALVLTRAIRKWQSEDGLVHWPVLLAGDLNTQPSEATYHLLASPHIPLSLAQRQDLQESLVVHNSVEKIPLIPPCSSTQTTVPDLSASANSGTSTPGQIKTAEEKEEDHDDKDDKIAANCRSPMLDGSDGLPTVDRLVKLYQEEFPFQGAMSVYDYVFILPSHPSLSLTRKQVEVDITKVICPPHPDQLGKGLPRKEVCASDHVAVGCELDIMW